jgi:hypothetical protein
MYDIDEDGEPIFSTYPTIQKAPVTEGPKVEGAGLKQNNKSKTFTSFKISTNTEPAKIKANKFINLKL